MTYSVQDSQNQAEIAVRKLWVTNLQKVNIKNICTYIHLFN